MGIDRSLWVCGTFLSKLHKMVNATVKTFTHDARDVAIYRSFPSGRFHFHDATHRQCGQVGADRQANIVRTAVDAINHQIAPVIELVGQALGGDAAE